MFDYALCLILGSIYGAIVGTIPMMGAAMGLLTIYSFIDIFQGNPYLGIVFMTSMIASVSTTDAFSSILTGIPGCNSSAATIIDGHPLAKQGQGARALGIAMFDSTFNGILWGSATFLLLPFYSKIILFFHIPELTMFMVLALACVGFISVRSPILAIASIILGGGLAWIGQNPINGVYRGTMGWEYLNAGIQFFPMISGLYAVPEIINGLKAPMKPMVEPVHNYWEQIRQAWKDFLSHKKDVVRGGIIGFAIGILPGIGGAIADLVAYGVTVSKYPNEKFGNGNIKGLLGCEGANNAQKPGSLIPTLLFGIPGAAFAAIMMVVCYSLGFEIGSQEVLTDTHFINSMGWSIVLSTVICFFLCLFFMKYLIKLLSIPFWIIAILIGSVILWGQIQYTHTMNDIYILLICGVVGLFCQSFGLSRPAVLITFIIFPRLENYSQQMFTIYSIGDLFQRPLFVILFLCSMGFVVWSVVRMFNKNTGIDFN